VTDAEEKAAAQLYAACGVFHLDHSDGSTADPRDQPCRAGRDGILYWVQITGDEWENSRVTRSRPADGIPFRDDEVVRAELDLELKTDQGTWVMVRFLVDSGTEITTMPAAEAKDRGLPIPKRPVRGLASNYLCDLRVGDTVHVVGPFGQSFLMPNHPRSHLVMICTGTGSAPMRAMTEWRRRVRRTGEFEGGKLLLFFGARTQQELPYFGPLQNLPKDGKMIVTDVTGSFFVPMKVTMLVAFVIALPVVPREPGAQTVRVTLTAEGGLTDAGVAFRDGVEAETTRLSTAPYASLGDDAAELAELADVFVSDAFGAAHRAHASTTGIATFLPAVAGLLMEREIDALSAALERPARPFVVIIGGAKISSKIGVLTHLLAVADAYLIGGGMANTLLQAQGVDTGASLVESDKLDVARQFLAEASRRGRAVYLPVDAVVSESISWPG